MNYGPLAQLVEHITFNDVVPSSSLGRITSPEQIRTGKKRRLRASFFCDFIMFVVKFNGKENGKFNA